MDKRTKEAELNHRIAEHIKHLIAKSNNKQLLLSLTITIGFVGALFFSKTQLSDASGVFEAPVTAQGVLITEPIIDPNHFFDDNVTKVQSFVALELYKLFNHTTSSIPTQQKQLTALAVNTFASDVKTNMDLLLIPKHLNESGSITSIELQLTAVPLVINAFTFTGESYTSIALNELNTTQIEKWTVDVLAKIVMKDGNGRTKRSPKIRFKVDVNDPTGLGLRSAFRLSAMSKWEVY
ncbi:hypothetical protein [Vibrio harveyi]|uniref:hypothetical protein n=1 Tax=Vibrio harveyi TaxID=669 RepID=UPI0024804859|nr:hypothetical protein [Vibrio harveyi]